jgi:KDO2-lipid IV(A) lauroyltransferase
MDFLLFALVYGPLWLLTWLPLPVLYLFSDFFAFVMWYVIPYRKKLVTKNLYQAFPGKSRTEIKKMARHSIHHLCDYFIESLAALHMTEKELNRRYTLKQLEVLEKLYSEDKDIMLIAGHYGNWEWLQILPFFTAYPILAVYKKLNNKYFDKLFIRIRSKYGVIAVSRQDSLRAISQYRRDGKRFAIFSLADQRPRWIQIQHWLTFMNQDTPVVLGPEKISRKYNLAIVFYKVNKVSRGHYENEFILLENDPPSTRSTEITEKYYQMLEKQIAERPEYYFWTHNRWKHKKDGSHIKFE